MRRCLTMLMLLAGAHAEAADMPPLQCWWRTDRVAVHVGEPLQLTLTCAAAETESATVVPDWDQLQPEVIDLAPFEVVAGTRSEEVVTPPWRYTQFQYTLRLTGEEFFGLDVPLPALEVAYSIAVGPRGGNVQMGRERTYLLPPLPMKILALVPARANDIEDATAHSFASVERKRSRASMAFMVGCGLLAAGVLYLLLFLRGVLRAMRTRRVKPAFRMRDWRVVVGCRSALRKLASAAAQDDWTDARVGDALTILRVLGALAIGVPVRQQISARQRPAESGEWVLRRLSLRRSRVAIAATITAAQLRTRTSASSVSDQTIQLLAAAIAACSDVRYGREAADDADGGMAEAGRAIQDALGASRELLVAALLPSRLRAV